MAQASSLCKSKFICADLGKFELYDPDIVYTTCHRSWILWEADAVRYKFTGDVEVLSDSPLSLITCEDLYRLIRRHSMTMCRWDRSNDPVVKMKCKPRVQIEIFIHLAIIIFWWYAKEDILHVTGPLGVWPRYVMLSNLLFFPPCCLVPALRNDYNPRGFILF